MADRRKVKLFLICILCAGLGSYCAKLIFDGLAKREGPNSLKPKPGIKATAKSIADQTAQLPPAGTVATLPAAPKEIKKVTPQETLKATQQPLSVNGIMFSPGSSYALINNKIVKEGDNIEGLTVIKISQNYIELKDGDTPLRISPDNKSF